LAGYLSIRTSKSTTHAYGSSAFNWGVTRESLVDFWIIKYIVIKKFAFA